MTTRPIAGERETCVSPRLSVILPAFNEEDNIASTLIQAEVYLSKACPEYELIVVDDGSRDGTAAIVEHMMERNPQIRLIRHGVNRGYGAALRSGFSVAKGELVFFMDADGQFDITDLSRLLPLAPEYDGIVGFRIRRHDSFIRRLNAFGWNTLIRFLLGVNIRDIDCAFKLYHRRVLEAITLESDGAMINAEMLAKVAARGFRLAEVGVSHYPRRTGQPTGSSPEVILKAFAELRILYRHLRREQKARGENSRGWVPNRPAVRVGRPRP